MSGYYKITFLRPRLTEDDDIGLRLRFYKKTKVYQLTEEQFVLMRNSDMLPKNMLDNGEDIEPAVRLLNYEGSVIRVDNEYEETISWTELPVLKYEKIAELEEE